MEELNLYHYEFEVTRVVDGDTIEGFINLGFKHTWWRSVRLFGINAPETRTKDLVEKDKGLRAKKWLTEQIKNGKKVILKTEKDYSGKYGRLLGTLYIDGVDINYAMILGGHAVKYTV